MHDEPLFADNSAIDNREAAVQVDLKGPGNIVGDKGYHSNHTLTKLREWDVRSYISEPQRGRRQWQGDSEAQQAVYGNRRRITGQYRKARGDSGTTASRTSMKTGGMRRVHLRGRDNVLKRVLIHVGDFNLR